jgi:hypothetical protein
MRRGMYRPASTSSQAGALTPDEAREGSDSILKRETLPCSNSGVLRRRFIVSSQTRILADLAPFNKTRILADLADTCQANSVAIGST